MKINQKHNGTIIGSIFTGAGLVLTFSFIIPVFSVLPGGLLQALIRTVFDLEMGETIQIIATLVILLAMFMGTLVWIVKSRKGKELGNQQVVKIMLLEYFIIHSLGFYILWVFIIGFSENGQLLFATVYSYPVSSLLFIPLGFLLDKIKKKPEGIEQEKST